MKQIINTRTEEQQQLDRDLFFMHLNGSGPWPPDSDINPDSLIYQLDK